MIFLLVVFAEVPLPIVTSTYTVSFFCSRAAALPSKVSGAPAVPSAPAFKLNVPFA